MLLGRVFFPLKRMDFVWFLPSCSSFFSFLFLRFLIKISSCSFSFLMFLGVFRGWGFSNFFWLFVCGELFVCCLGWIFFFLPAEEEAVFLVESHFLPLHPYINKISLWKDLFTNKHWNKQTTEMFYLVKLNIIKILDIGNLSEAWNVPFSATNSQTLTRQHKNDGL